MRRRVRTGEARGARETQGPAVSFCLSLTLAALGALATRVSHDIRGKSCEFHKMEGVTTNELRMLDRRLERLRSGSGRVLPMDEAFAELDYRIAR